jgi:histidyl-tRNA synthetase
MGRSLTRQLNYANRKGFKRVVIVGEKELVEGCVSVRDMETAEQQEVKLDELINHLL